MAIAARISSAELIDQLTNRFAGSAFEARLINAPGVVYEPGITNDTNFLDFEVTAGLGGYERQVINYNNLDVSLYGDGGVSMVTKATIFTQDGSETSIPFSHAALVWGTGIIETATDPSEVPTAGNDGTYTNIPVESAGGNGAGMKVDLEVTNGDTFTLTLASSGYGYEVDDILVISDGVLAGLGAIEPGAGQIAFTVETVSDFPQAGQIFSVAQVSSPALLSAGNEAVFYWNLKQFGFYNV